MYVPIAIGHIQTVCNFATTMNFLNLTLFLSFEAKCHASNKKMDAMLYSMNEWFSYNYLRLLTNFSSDNVFVCFCVSMVKSKLYATQNFDQ